MRPTPLLLPLLAACHAAPGPATWAVDPLWIEGADEGGLHGFQTWELFDQHWDNNHHERHYVCGAVVRLFGDPVSCEDCDGAWSIRTRLVETDCTEDDIDINRFTGLRELSLRAVGSVPTDAAPYPGQSTFADADYGAGLAPYGWAWPAALDHGVATSSDGSFDGSEPYQLRPTVLWDLRQ